MDKANIIKIPISTYTIANWFDIIDSRQKPREAQLHSPHRNASGTARVLKLKQ